MTALDLRTTLFKRTRVGISLVAQDDQSGVPEWLVVERRGDYLMISDGTLPPLVARDGLPFDTGHDKTQVCLLVTSEWDADSDVFMLARHLDAVETPDKGFFPTEGLARLRLTDNRLTLICTGDEIHYTESLGTDYPFVDVSLPQKVARSTPNWHEEVAICEAV